MIHTSTPCSDNWISTMYPQKFSIIYVIHRYSCYGQLLITLTVSWRCYEKRHIVNGHGAIIDRHDKSICCRSVYCRVFLMSCRPFVVSFFCRVFHLSCRSSVVSIFWLSILCHRPIWDMLIIDNYVDIVNIWEFLPRSDGHKRSFD